MFSGLGYDELKVVARILLEVPERPRPAASLARAELPDRYKRDGFVGPLHGLCARQVEEALAGFKRFEALHRARVETRTAYIMNHVWLPWLRDIAKEPAIVSAVTEAFGSKDVYLYNTQLLARGAGKSLKTDMGLDWHRDAVDSEFSRLKPVDRRHFLTVFVALSTCDRRHGCMLVRPTGYGGQVRPEEELAVELLPGEFSLHGPSTEHTGGLNASGETRYCAALRYVSARTQDLYAESKEDGGLGRDVALLVAGADEGRRRLFDPMPELPEEASEDGRLLREELIRRRSFGLPVCW